MPITPHHTAMPCFSHVESTKLYCRLLGFEQIGACSRRLPTRAHDILHLVSDRNREPSKTNDIDPGVAHV